MVNKKLMMTKKQKLERVPLQALKKRNFESPRDTQYQA